MIRLKTAILAAVLALLALPVVAQQASRQAGPMTGEHGAMGQGMQGPGMMGQGAMGQGMQNPWMMGCPGMMMQQPGSGPGAMMLGGPMTGGPGRYIEGRLAFLKTELGITQKQDALWNAYAEAARSAAASMQAMHDQMMSGGMPATPPERMLLHNQMMSAQLDASTTVQKVFVPLYDALSPEQKKVADALMGMMGMM